MKYGDAVTGYPDRSGGRRTTTIVLILAAAAMLSSATLLAVRLATSRPAAPAANPDGIGFSRLDRRAPDLRLPELRGRGTIDLTGLAGKPIVMNFWSSTCHICTSETPALASVARAVAGKVTFLGIDSLDQRGPATAFVARYRVPYQIAFDPAGTAAARYGLPGLPVTFFLSASGKTILGENVGALTPGTLRAILRELYGVS